MRIKHFLLTSVSVVAVTLCSGALNASAWAQDATASMTEPATFSADEMTHDKELGLITARGNVEVNHEGRTLIADTISYDQNNDIIRASGHVALHRINGDVLFADMIEITGDLKNGLIENFHAVLADRSRFAANQAQLVNDETLSMQRAVYSACQPCQDDPSRPLLWQLKAVKVVQDRINKTVEYEHAWMEFAGVPVLYTPYFSHPDPTVKRKSGFLAPTFGISSDIGTALRVPYFYVIDDYSDTTLTPIVTSHADGGVLGQYRQRFTKGELNVDGSVVSGSDNVANDPNASSAKQITMAHVDASALFDINPTWRMGGAYRHTTSDTYMRRYGLGHPDTLISEVHLEGFRGNNYANFQAMTFQGLRDTDSAKTTPMVLPVVEYSHQGEANRYGAYNTLDTNITMLTRDQGVDSQRVSIHPAWNLPYIAPKGDIYKLTASMGIDFFHVQSLSAPSQYQGVIAGEYNGAALRVTPQVEFDWSWPLARRVGSVTEVLEPIGQVIVSPYGGNSFKMPNEDSQDFDFNDTNVFSANRFTGYDRVESGPRANYGVKWGITGDGGGSTSVLLGQSYRLKSDDTFKIGSGLEDNFSDLVGRLSISPSSTFNLLYRTRIDKDKLDFNRNEVGANGSLLETNYAVNYVFFDSYQDSEFTGRREISYSFNRSVTEYWKASFKGLNDLTSDGGLRNLGLGATYDDECFTFNANATRTYYQDREIKPTNAIVFRLVFKTLGEV